MLAMGYVSTLSPPVPKMIASFLSSKKRSAYFGSEVFYTPKRFAGRGLSFCDWHPMIVAGRTIAMKIRVDIICLYLQLWRGAAPAFPPAMCIRRNILHLLREISSRQGSKRCTPQSRWLERQGFGRIVGISYITSSSGKVRRCLISMMVAPASLRRCRLVGHLRPLQRLLPRSHHRTSVCVAAHHISRFGISRSSGWVGEKWLCQQKDSPTHTNFQRPRRVP
jgi:hypothetical protein